MEANEAVRDGSGAESKMLGETEKESDQLFKIAKIIVLDGGALAFSSAFFFSARSAASAHGGGWIKDERRLDRRR